LPIGQHIVAHNTFEEQMIYGGCAIRTCFGATPVVATWHGPAEALTAIAATESRGPRRATPRMSSAPKSMPLILTKACSG
jgi:hypothetical protein